jgi:hypothetical protein
MPLPALPCDNLTAAERRVAASSGTAATLSTHRIVAALAQRPPAAHAHDRKEH